MSVMIGARKNALLLLASVVLAGSLAAAPPSRASTASTHTRMSWIYVMDHVFLWHVGPNRHTRYGRIDFTGTWRSTRHGLKPNYHVSYHPPANPAIRTPANYCWPWEDFSTCKGWNNPESWDWGGLYDDIKPDQPWDFTDQEKCAKGEEKGTIGIFGKSMVGLVLGSGKAAVKMTPPGYITGVIASCLLSVWFG